MENIIIFLSTGACVCCMVLWGYSEDVVQCMVRLRGGKGSNGGIVIIRFCLACVSLLFLLLLCFVDNLYV